MLELIFFMYVINVQIFIKFYNDFLSGKTNSLFDLLKQYKLDVYKYMEFFRKIVIYGGYLICLIVLIITFVQ